jgi:type IV secretory pathway ATPase VirB11/archaellum biosynthesis ATPase
MERRYDHVPAPEPPDSPDAWYAPDVRSQATVHPGVVATVRETGDGFAYEVREPVLGEREERALGRVRDHFDRESRRRPLTREGARERAAAGFAPKYERALDRLLSVPPSARRRVDYHALADLRLLGEATPLALDERIDVVDLGRESDDRVVVHTADYAPCRTALSAETEHVDRVAGERLATYEVGFDAFSVPVVIYREHLLGSDHFEAQYAVLEPDLLPGDEELIAECKERVWEANVSEVVDDRAAFVRERARRFLSRRLTARNTRAWVDATSYRIRSALAEYGLAVPPVDSRFAEDRLDDLVYYVLRDYVGYGILTVPIRDPHLEDVEANRVGERVKVIPRADEVPVGRVPANLAFETETAFVNVVSQLAASDGTELNASTPTAKVNLDPPGVDETIRCAVALPVVSEGGPHVSVRKQAADVMTPPELVDRDAVSVDLVTLLWLCYEHRAVVLFSGPTGVGKTTLMNAHMPFVPYDDRPVSIDEGSREVRLPHETGVSLTTRDHENEYKRVSMAQLMTETNYLNPDVEVIAEVNTPASFETFAETINTGHGVVGTTHSEDVETLVNRVIEQGLPAYLLEEIDLVVFPHHVDGERYVAEAVEFVSGEEARECGPETAVDRPGLESGVVEKGDREIHWNTVLERDVEGEFHLDYAHPTLGDAERDAGLGLFERIADATDRSVEAVEREFHRKRGYVEYMVQRGVTDFDRIFEFVSDLRTDEAATVERVRRELDRSATGERGAADEHGAAEGERGAADDD